MKKTILIILATALSVTATLAQHKDDVNSLPGTTTVIPYKLEVGYNTTTLIVFPMPLVPAADRGSNEIIIQQEKVLTNVLKIKADKRDFQPTNLHAYTIDGKLYVFNVSYTEYPGRTTFDLSKLINDTVQHTPVMVGDNLIKQPYLKEMASQARQAKHFFSRKTTKYEMKLQLRTIHAAKNWLVLGFRLVNQSNLSYDMDFTRMYIRDKQQVKRSSIQEQEITPVYKENLTTIAGGKKDQFIIIIPKVTIPGKKEFLIEVFEKNGGRNMSLRIKNKHLLKAKAIEYSL